jgi:DNA primase
VAFGGRALDPGAKAKYLNSPETELFHKGSLLFNHHRARAASHDRGQIVVVEGYVDVIAMNRAGYPRTVAPLGTALTADQCALLWSLDDEPILCFDGDNAGRKAAFRAIELSLPLIGAGKSLRFALLPEGQDPDDLARSGGPEAIAEVLRGAKPLAEMLFARETEGRAFETPEQRAGLERRLRELTAAITDEMLRKHYVADIARRLQSFFGPAQAPPPATRSRDRQPRGGRRGAFFDPGPRIGIAGAPLPPPGNATRRSPEPPREIAILAVLLGHPDLLERHFEEIAELELASRSLSGFRAHLVGLAPEAYSTPDALAAALDEHGNGSERDRILAAAARMPNWWCLKAGAPAPDAETVLRQCLALQRKSGTLNKECKLAEAALAAEPTEQNLARLLDIKASLADLANAEAAIEGFGELSGRQAAAV